MNIKLKIRYSGLEKAKVSWDVLDKFIDHWWRKRDVQCEHQRKKGGGVERSKHDTYYYLKFSTDIKTVYKKCLGWKEHLKCGYFRKIFTSSKHTYFNCPVTNLWATCVVCSGVVFILHVSNVQGFSQNRDYSLEVL